MSKSIPTAKAIKLLRMEMPACSRLFFNLFRKESFINNDDLLVYILTDPDLKTTVLGDSDFLELLINESTDFVIDVYFEGTKTSPAVYNYITAMLADDTFKTELKIMPELKELVKD